jgi:CAAX prenyl protease-like protein
MPPRLATLFAQREDAAMPRILPFVLFMVFIVFASLLRWLGTLLSVPAATTSILALWLYPVRMAVVVATLLYMWPAYTELRPPVGVNRRDLALAIGVGVIVYLAWIRMTWPWAMQGQTPGYNPFQAGAVAGICLAVVRLFGAAVVVPVMEELFWRSFIIRYLVSPHFASVPLGTFTPLSCLVTIVLFGLEHHLWLAGMMAGALYNLVLYRTQCLWPCILAHAVTNLLLSIHVLLRAEWQWW